MQGFRSAAAAALLWTAACADGGPPEPPPTGSPSSVAISLGATPMSLDDRGVPQLLRAAASPGQPAARTSLPAGTAPLVAARHHLARLAPVWGVRALPDLEALGEVAVDRGTVARLRQSLDGMPVAGEVRVLVGRAGELVAVRGVLVDRDAPRATARFAIDEAGAVARMVARAYGPDLAPTVDVERSTARRLWFRVGGTLVAAWQVEAFTNRAGSTSGDAWRTTIAADDGRVLAHTSLVADAAFRYRVYAEVDGAQQPADGPTADFVPHPTGRPDGSFPAYVGPQLVTIDRPDPWLPDAATTTTGNNVDAYVDLNPPTGLSAGDFRATTTAPRTFDRTYNLAAEPLATQDQQMAGVTSLFYAINWLHDFWYTAGFTEQAGNAQRDNYGRGGVAGDPILAEAQDDAIAGMRNNANMATPTDGLSPRMQVYLWAGRDLVRELSYAPSGRTPLTNVAGFGPRSFARTAQVVASVDDTAPTGDGCTAPTNAVTGRIVLVDRGNCTFKAKALAIQAAGGVGMILANNVAGAPPPQLGNDTMLPAEVEIAMFSVTLEEGALLRADLAGGAVTATARRTPGPEAEGSLDATLVAHEFGHYLHHRLQHCETAWCRAISEGWGDFVALLLTARAGDNLDGAYPFSVYTTQTFSLDPGYFGIRRAPYSINPAINALSYRHMADGEELPTAHPLNGGGDNAEVHNAGEVWAAAMWEVYVALQRADQGARRDFEAVRARMARYVVAGLAMAPDDGTPTETRDALLAVASDEDRPIMAAAFARRGFGSCAVTPARDSETFVGIVESREVVGSALAGAPLIDDAPATCDRDGVLDAGERAVVRVPLTNQGTGDLTDLTVTATTATAGVTVVSKPVAIARLAVAEVAEVEVEVELATGTAGAIAAELTIAVEAPGACTSTLTRPVVIAANVDDLPASSATDAFDAVSVWEARNAGAAGWTQVWDGAVAGRWHATPAAQVSDVALVSPPLTAGDGPLAIAIRHRYALELSAGDALDGGVIELSVDGGASWRDVAELGAAPGYGAAIAAASGNPLAGRAAYTGRSAAYPGYAAVALDLGTQLAGQTFQLRFRLATDAAVATEGWDIDEVAVSGLIDTPFPTRVAETERCDANADDGGCCEAGPVRPGGALLALGVLALVTLRRRGSRRTARTR